jgi:hypothetical protein
VVRDASADALAEALKAAGVGQKAYYRVPAHRQPAMREWAQGVVLPATEEVAATHLAIPMSPVLTAGACGRSRGRRPYCPPPPLIDCSDAPQDTPCGPPVHRHSLPQIALDAGLVALAYYLAYRLRFDEGVPEDYQQLFERSLAFVVVGSPIIFAAFGLYAHWMRYSSQREYMRIAQPSWSPSSRSWSTSPRAAQLVLAPSGRFVEVPVPAGVLVLFGLLMLVFLARGARRSCTSSTSAAARLPRRRGARSVLIVGAGDGGPAACCGRYSATRPRLRPVGFVDDDPRKQGAPDRGSRCSGPTRARRVLGRRRARRGS